MEVNEKKGSFGTGKEKDEREQLKLDQLMRILFKLSKKMTVNLINGLFDECLFSREVSIRYDNGEFTADEYDRMAGDMFITIESIAGKFTYHIEFQTLNDQSMVIRMFRYGFEKAIEEALASGSIEGNARMKTVVTFPRQLVIFLEENEAIGDALSFTLRMPNGMEIDYTVPVMRYWTYTAEELRRKNLYALLPLLVFGSRKKLRTIQASSRPEADKTRLMAEQFEQLKRTIRQIVDVLTELHDGKVIGTGDMIRILKAMQHITEYLYNRYGEYRIIDKEAMRMSKLWFDPRVMREARREGKRLGKLEGMMEGKQEGRQEGKQEGKIEIARNLLLLGADFDLIVNATGLTREELMQMTDR